MTAFNPRTKKGVDDVPLLMTKVTIPKLQINIIKLSMADFMFDSNDEATSGEGKE